MAGGQPAFTYVLPFAAGRPSEDPELDAYLAWIAERAELIVVDGSPAEVFDAHHRRWAGFCQHAPPEGTTVMGKVANVVTGLRMASRDRVVVADDDVRYGAEIIDLVDRLEQADVVRPQNYFHPLPWHAAWDAGRSLLNRVSGGDWPGTLAVRRSTVLAAGGYADVMFENYELAATVEAVGGRHEVAADLFVCRRPPTTRHFLSQRVRQAYDELARPRRLAAQLAVLPCATALIVRRQWAVLGRSALAGAVLVVAAAEVGRRRGGAHAVFPLRCSLMAPAWVGERAVCAWLAMWAMARGGIPYRGQRVRTAALRASERRRRVAASGSRGGAAAGDCVPSLRAG